MITLVVEIKPSVLSGRVTAPPSKSFAHRALICAALCEGETKISNFFPCADTSATIGCLRAMGADISIRGTDCFVKGFGNCPSDCSLYCNESGSTLRFLIPLAFLGGNITFTGAKRLLERPLNVYDILAKSQGLNFQHDQEGVIASGKLKSGEFEIKGNISSQFITGLMFVLPLLNGDSIINLVPPTQSRPYIDLTVEVMRDFGIEVEFIGEQIKIKGSQEYMPCNYVIEGDCSNAAFLEAINVINGNVEVEGINPDTLQGDYVYKKHLNDIKVGRPTISLSHCPDLAPVLMAAAAANNGAVFTDAERLKIKESDRGKAMEEELSKFGVRVENYSDTIIVNSGISAPTMSLCSHNDHRIVMALSILCLKVGGKILGAEAVSKSFPEFFDCISALGAKVNLYEDE